MLQSIFIVSSSTGEVVIEKHWRATTSRSVCETFWREADQHPLKENVPPVLEIGKYFLFSILRGPLFYIGVVTNEVPAMLVFELLKRIYDLHCIYFGVRITEATLRDNFTTVYHLFEEVGDYGHPMITEPNVLTSLVAPPSMLGRLANAMGGKSGVASALPPAATGSTPWRREGARYTQNEIYFDLVEKVDCAIESNGTVAHFRAYGIMQCKAHLTGMPDIAMFLEQPGAIDVSSMHPCVRVARWEREKVLSFVPADGKFKMLTYEIPLRDNPVMPFYCKPQLMWGADAAATGKLVVSLGHRPMHSLVLKRKKDGSRVDATVDDVVVRIGLPAGVQTAELKSSQGPVQFDPQTRVAVWEIGKLNRDRVPELRGVLSLAPGEAVPRGDEIVAKVEFKLPGASLSGCRIESLRLTGENYTPYKGMRSIVQSGAFEVRA